MGSLSILWRQTLTAGLLEDYFGPRVVYWLRRERSVPDADARIAVEAGHFADASVLMVRDVLENAIKLTAYIGVVYTISPMLCSVMTLYAALGAAVTINLFGRPLVKLDRGIRAREAAFRSCLARCQDRAESLAFSGGEAAEGAAASRRYAALRDQQWMRVWWRTGLASFRDFFAWAAYLVPIAFVAPLWLRGEVEFGAITQTVMAFQASLTALSVMIRKFRSVSSLAAEGGRLEELATELSCAASVGASPAVKEGAPGVSVEHLTLSLPSGDTLYRDLSFELQPGHRLLILGASGAGKTTLLRALAGLWAHGSGHVRRSGSVVFLPQDPYIPEASLREVLTFPAPSGVYPDEAILDAATKAKLGGVLGRYTLGAAEDWEQVLSRGELQRCTFCRVLLQRPELAVLDEATSALDADTERELFAALEASCVITVSHRASLSEVHTHVLTPKGSHWVMQPTG